MPVLITIEIGGFVRWLFKGGKTRLKDEINGRFDATWGRTYRFENYIIGMVTIIIIIGIIMSLMYFCPFFFLNDESIYNRLPTSPTIKY